MKKSKILITGSSGFIGDYLFNYLNKLGYDVFGIDKVNKSRSTNNFFKVNILDYQKLNNKILEINPEIIIHLAARTDLGFNDKLENFSENTDGVMNIIKVCNETDSIEKLIFTSTILVCKVGYTSKNADFYNPQSIYGESKAIGEKMIKKYLKKKFIIIRPTSIWGPSDGSNYESFFSQISKKKYFHIRGFNPKITFGYIGNFCFQLLELMKNEDCYGSFYYLGDYKETELKSWADSIYNEFHGSQTEINIIPYLLIKILACFGDLLNKIGFKFPINSYRLKNLTNDRIYDMDRTKKIIGKNLPFNLNQATKITVDWFIKTKTK